MKRDVKIVNGLPVVLKPGKACNKCVFFNNEYGDCNPDVWECLYATPNKVWRHAYPFKRFIQKLKDLYHNPVVGYIILGILIILVAFLIMAGESMIEHALSPLKQ